MKKLIAAFLLLSVLCIQNAAAKPVKEDEAKQFAKNWAREKWGRKIDSISTKEKAKSSVQQISSEESLYYVLSFSQGGWMIISGDDVAYPVIAFSPTGTYSAQNRPIQFEDWMENVKKEITGAIKAKHDPLPKAAAAWKKFNVSAEEFAAKSSFAPAEASSVEAASAGPLLKTTWNQDEFYNASCPADAAGPDGHVYAGCVATAMAQVMKYHNHPATGSGSHSYAHSVYGTLSANFGSTTYNWASMPNSLSDYDSDVAKLLYHAGVSVNMDYAPDGSGAFISDAANALKTYFKYSSSLAYVSKSSYSTDAWTALLRAEIDNNRPIIYGGHGTGGHAFVCDGYSGTDFFHFNWGWSGSYDDYFYLNDLTPGSHDYTSYQGAVIDIRPPLSPVGSFDSADCSSLSGWAKDPDTTAPISVHFYKDGPAGTGTYLDNATADIYRGDLPYTDKNHGFSLSLPDSLNDGAAHQIYAYAIDDAGGTNTLLTNSPKTVQCGLTSDQLAAVMSVINELLLEDVPSTAPDLSVINPSASKTSLAPGESLTFSATAKNGGTASSAATTLRWYRSTDATITTADTQLGSQSVSALSAGQTSAQSATLAAPSAAGTYWLGACIDAVSGETNTGNNCSSGVQITVTAPPSAPDLSVINPSASKTSLAPGESLTFSATAKNGGTASSAATTLRWYRSTDATITTADTQLGSQSVGALSAGQTSAQSATLTAPSAAGTYWLGACIDAVSGETTTGNNCSSGVQITVTAPPAAPDLSVINPSASKTSLAPGESLTFSATAKNGGAASSAATTLRWYRSTDATITTADSQLGSQSVGALSAGQTSAQSATLTAPSAAGTYWLGACIDAVSGETTTGNNCSSGVQITVTAPPAAPDLSVINPSASKTSFVPGESLTFSATAKNGGTASSAATTLRWYRSTDATITTADSQLGSQAVGALSAGQTSAQSATLAAPSAAGTYWLGACIDAVSGETNTGNNCSSGVQITVTAGKPDLIVSSLRHFWLVDAGISKDATAEFTNQGTAASVATTATCYYINKATQEVSGAVCQMQVPALAVNQTASRTTTLTAPCSEGAYQLKICVNSGANVESNTGNNCMYGDLSVVGNCPKKAFLPAIKFLLR